MFPVRTRTRNNKGLERIEHKPRVTGCKKWAAVEYKLKRKYKMKIEKKVIKAKILRALGITKPIQLDKYEIQWIKLCKGHYKEKYPHKGEWTDVLKPMFNEIYGWTAEEFYPDFLQCIFIKLLEIHLKIKHDQSGHEHQLKEIFNRAFYKSVFRQQELPIERAISELCGLIQCNQVIENDVHRYYL